MINVRTHVENKRITCSAVKRRNYLSETAKRDGADHTPSRATDPTPGGLRESSGTLAIVVSGAAPGWGSAGPFVEEPPRSRNRVTLRLVDLIRDRGTRGRGEEDRVEGDGGKVLDRSEGDRVAARVESTRERIAEGKLGHDLEERDVEAEEPAVRIVAL